MKNEFNSNQPLKTYIKLSIPILSQQIIYLLYSFSDTYFVGKTNNVVALSVISLSFPIQLLISSVINLFGIGGSTIIAELNGEKNEAKVKSTFAFSFYFIIVVSIIISIFSTILMNPITKLLGSTQENVKFLKQYIYITVSIGSIFTITSGVWGKLVQGYGKNVFISISYITGLLVNIILDYYFINYIFKHNIIFGCALATLIGYIITFIMSIIYIIYKKFNLSIKNIFDYKLLKRILYVGFPSFLAIVLSLVSNLVINNILSDVSLNAAASIGIARKIITISFNVSTALTISYVPYLAFLNGNKKIKILNKAFFIMLSITVTINTLLFLFYICKSNELVTLFSKNTDVVILSVKYFNILSFAVIPCSVVFCFCAFFQAIKKIKLLIYIYILRKGTLDIYLMIILKKIYGADAVFYATVIVETLVMLILICLFIMNNKRQNKENFFKAI